MSRQNLSFGEIFKKGAVIFNPVLIQLVGLCPVIAASTSFLTAVMLSVVLCIELTVTCVLASLFFKGFPRWVRVALYMLIGIAMICPILYYVDNFTLIDLSLGTQIYLPLIAVNSVTAVHCEQFAVKNNVKTAFFDAVAVGIGVSVIFILTGATREILGNATFAGIDVNIPITFKGMSLPFGCLIMLGFLASLLKLITSRLSIASDDEEEETEPITENPIEISQAKPEEAPAPENPAEEPDITKAVYDEFNEFLKSLDLDSYIQGEGENK